MATQGPAYTIDLVRDRAVRKREAEGLALHEVGARVGAAASTVMRFEDGKSLSAAHFLAIAEWAGFRLTNVSP